MNKIDQHSLNVNDVVQLNPETCRQPLFAGCFLVVTELKTWGVQGYIQVVGQEGKPGGQAYYRAKWDEIEYVGIAVWSSV